MIQYKLHHTKFPVLRRCYARLLTVRELSNRAKFAPLSEAASEKLRAARANSNADKSALRKIKNVSVTLEELNATLERLLSLPPEDAHALIDKWEYKARQR